MSRLILASLLATAIVACEPPASEAGWVIDIESTSVIDISGFTLRTEDGREITFRVDAVALDDGSFPPSHLREHLALNQPVAVAYRLEDGERHAFRLRDALWLQP